MNFFGATTWVELAWLDVAVAQPHALDQCGLLGRVDGQHLTRRAFVVTTDDLDDIVFFDALCH